MTSAPFTGKDFTLVTDAVDPRVLPSPEHVGVWLDRCYYGEEEKEKTRRRVLYERAIDALRGGRPAVATYRSFFNHWQRELASSARHRRVLVVEATSRVLLHPSSNASVTDGSVLLHHTYGVPYLPGSGLKGIARAWMRRTVEERREGARSDARDAEIVRAVFGHIPRDEEGDEARAEASVVEFLDALWVPDAPQGAPTDWSPLALDVINPHQSRYYTGDDAPGDTNEPVPTHRLTVSPGARFMVAVEGVSASPDESTAVRAWVDHVVDGVLGPALTNMGFGAWTSAGYGRFAVLGGAKRDATESSATSGAGNASGGSEWHEVMVSLDPGSGRLSAALPGSVRRIAEVINPRAAALRESLSAELQERLKKKRALKLRVRAEKFGNAWWIVELKPSGG